MGKHEEKQHNVSTGWYPDCSTHQPGVLPFQWPAAILDQLFDVPALNGVRPTTEKIADNKFLKKRNNINTADKREKRGLWWSDDVNLKESRVKQTQGKVIHEKCFHVVWRFFGFCVTTVGPRLSCSIWPVKTVSSGKCLQPRAVSC